MYNETEKILGTIGAMETLIENFPMSIFNPNKPFDIKCAIDFILKILIACGVDITEDVIQPLFEKIFNVKTVIKGDINDVYQAIMDLEINEQSKFMQTLEYGVKGILMALLSSIFSCSVIPIIPDKFMDVGSIDPNFTQAMRDIIKNGDLGEKLVLNTSSFDLFNILDINPFSSEGKLYYHIEGGDAFYERKEYVTTQTLDPNVDEYEYKDMEAIPLYFDFGPGHDIYVAMTSALTQGVSDDYIYMDSLVLKITEPAPEDIDIIIKYNNEYQKNNPGPQESIVQISKGQKESEAIFLSPFIINYAGENGGGQRIEDIKVTSTMKLKDEWEIASSGYGSGYANAQCVCGDKFIYLDEEKNKPVGDFWYSRGGHSMRYFLSNKHGDEHSSPRLRKPIDVLRFIQTSNYVYEKMDNHPKSSEVPDKDIIRYTSVPTIVTKNSPKYIRVHTGLTETELYKTYDMNAFLWYVLNKSRQYTQIEVNKSMWDSRNYSRKHFLERNSPSLWNKWYNSKTTENSEFNYYDPAATYDRTAQNTLIYPILQCNKMPYSTNDLLFEIPAQKYHKPTSKINDSTYVYNFIRVNTTIYQYNWEYLNNIQIFNPKIILFGMFDTLLNGALSMLMGTKINLKKEEIKGKISTSIAKYIDALDTEVEDCYFTFSNDDFNRLLEDMLLSKYNATLGNGNNQTVKQHDIKDYFDAIDSINPSAQQNGSVTGITKVISDISATKGSGSEINYGIDLGYDDSWWKAIVESLTMALIQSIITPQVMILVLINFRVMGITSTEDLVMPDQEKIVALIINKVLGMIKSIIGFIKDQILEILMQILYEKILPKITQYMIIISLEKIQMWIDLLLDTLNCIPTINIAFKKQFNQLDEVNYADIVTEQIIPESNSTC